MLSFFADGELPGIDGGPFASRDVTSFYEVWQTASQIESGCLLRSGKPGWASQGNGNMNYSFVNEFCIPLLAVLAIYEIKD
jgi:hypothetical protein